MSEKKIAQDVMRERRAGEARFAKVAAARDAADARVKELEEALHSDALFLRRFLEKLTHHSVTGLHGQVVNGYAAAEIPEWEMRQRLDDIEAAIAPAEALLTPATKGE